MEYQKLGSTRLEVSRLAFGGWLLGGHGWGEVDGVLAKEAVHAAVEGGINFFDTADVYGLGASEIALSEALGPRRRNVVICSKFGVTFDGAGNRVHDASPARLKEALAGSLARLDIERLPLYLIHWPDGRATHTDTLAELRRFEDEGIIGYVGCSNFDGKAFAEMHQIHPMALVQVPWNLLMAGRATSLMVAARELGVPVVAYDVLAKGLLTGKFSADAKFGSGDVRSRDSHFEGDRLRRNLETFAVVREVARAYARNPAQIAIRWVLDTPGVDVAIVGARSPAQVRQNLGATDWRLSKRDWDRLNRAFEVAGVAEDGNGD